MSDAAREIATIVALNVADYSARTEADSAQQHALDMVSALGWLFVSRAEFIA